MLQPALFKRLAIRWHGSDLTSADMAVVLMHQQANADKMASMYRKLHSFRRWKAFVILQAERYHALRAALEVIVQADEATVLARTMR
eukprot:scaffold168136_cov37-Prasinocladus_malaysianus.AAC.1